MSTKFVPIMETNALDMEIFQNQKRGREIKQETLKMRGILKGRKRERKETLRETNRQRDCLRVTER
jgi:hypothetical protein